MTEKDKSLVCLTESGFMKIIKFIKNIFKKDQKQLNNKTDEEFIIENTDYQKHTKDELIEIYNKAKRNEYDLEKLGLDEILLLIEFIKEEIKFKEEKLELLVGNNS